MPDGSKAIPHLGHDPDPFDLGLVFHRTFLSCASQDPGLLKPSMLLTNDGAKPYTLHKRVQLTASADRAKTSTRNSAL